MISTFGKDALNRSFALVTSLLLKSIIADEDVVKKLTYFSKHKIIVYIPIRTKPQLVYAYERLGTEHIQLSDENYKNQIEAAQARLTALLEFVSNPMECRSKVLLEYFGEKKARRCGICDVCITENKMDLNELEFSIIETQINDKLNTGPKHLYELVAAITDSSEDDIIQVVRWLVENKKLIKQKDGLLTLYNQLDLGFDS